MKLQSRSDKKWGRVIKKNKFFLYFSRFVLSLNKITASRKRKHKNFVFLFCFSLDLHYLCNRYGNE